ncbi:hypothetical protein, partial [Campylobacter coli]|uniref:hypothetical protein n=1 Tax=Campylobacter coli TaxID=195 RepID=UPI0037520412
NRIASKKVVFKKELNLKNKNKFTIPTIKNKATKTNSNIVLKKIRKKLITKNKIYNTLKLRLII